MKSDEQTQNLARLASLEYLLEMGYATWLSQMTGGELREFERAFEARITATWETSKGDPFIGPMTSEVLRETQGLTVRFWKRVRDREDQIRRERHGQPG
jgi:hypothetical protein